MSSNKTTVREYFEVRSFKNGSSKRYCTICSHSYSLNTGNGTLSGHIEERHQKVWKEIQNNKRQKIENESSAVPSAAVASSSSLRQYMVEQDSISEPQTNSSSSTPQLKRTHSTISQSSQSTQVTLQTAFASSMNTSYYDAIAYHFAINKIPDVVVEHPAFQAFCNAIRCSTLPIPQTREVVRDSKASLRTRLRQAVIQRIIGSRAPVTIAIDGWTNIRQSKVTNVMLLCSGVAYFWRSVVNKHSANTATWLENALTPVLNELISLNIRFVALVADNEAVNDALFEKLLSPFPFLIRVPCAAHTIQLVVRQIMNIKRFKSTLTTVKEILSAFEKQKEARNRLQTLQSQEQGSDPSYVLIKPNDTRWNSHLYACQRLLQLKRFIDFIFPQSLSFWSELSLLIDYLSPFQTATDVLQSDSATLTHVWSQFNILLNHIQKNASAYGSSLTIRAEAALNYRWKKQVNQPATIACTILSLNIPNDNIAQEVINEANSFIIEFGVKYLSFYALTSFSLDALKSQLTRQFASFQGRRSPFHTVDERVATLTCDPSIPFNPLDVWDLYATELSVVAKALLTITASEAAVERSFSKQDAIHTKKRNRMKDEVIERDMFISINGQALKQHVHHRPPTIDLPPFIDITEPIDEDNTLTDTDSSGAEDDSSLVASSSSSSSSAAAQSLHRTQSGIELTMRTFLESYIGQNGLTLSKCKRWTQDRRNHLEAALIQEASGLFTTDDAIAAIKEILAEQSEESKSNSQ